MRINIPQSIIKRVFCLGLCLFMFMQAMPAEAGTKKAQLTEKVKSKNIRGEVVSFTEDLIVVEYYRKSSISKEILIPQDKKTKLENFGKSGDVKTGDSVRVIFKETYKVDEDGKRSDFKRVAVKISLLRRAN